MLARIALATAALALAAPAAAQTLYKLIDKNGKVTYSQDKPKDFDGQVVPLDVNPDRNTMTMPKLPAKEDAKLPPSAREGMTPPPPRRKAEDGSIVGGKDETPEEKLERARKAYAEAKDNPGPDDVRWIGNVSGGTRAIPTEAYQRRLESLERAVKDAEDEVRKAR